MPAPAVAPPIDFHVNVDHRLTYACRVLRKARQAGRTAFVCCADGERRRRLDQALWTFSALDFLAHVELPSPLAARTPIWLGAEPPAAARDVLLCLDDEALADFASTFARFERVIEVVSTEDTDRARARQRFKAYREAGLAPVAHDVGAA